MAQVFEQSYIIMGHASDKLLTFEEHIVPPNALIAVEAHCGEETFLSQTLPRIKNIAASGKRPYNLTARSAFKRGFAYYKTGQTFPNFSYSFFMYFPDDEDPQSVNLFPSGVIPIDETKPYLNIFSRYYKYQRSAPIDSIPFVSLYAQSVFPTATQVDYVLSQMKARVKSERGQDYIVTLNDIIREINTSHIFDATQHKLFEIVGAGVYYHTMCRTTEFQNFIFNDPRQFKISNNRRLNLANPNTSNNRTAYLGNLERRKTLKMKKNYLTEKAKTQQNLNLASAYMNASEQGILNPPRTLNTPASAIIKRQIEEAEFHRKGFFQNIPGHFVSTNLMKPASQTKKSNKCSKNRCSIMGGAFVANP